MKLKKLARLAWLTVLMLLLCILLPLSSSCSDGEQVYIQKLETKFLKCFFPPMGGWDLSDGSAKAILGCDGTIKDIQVIKHLTNRFSRRFNKQYSYNPIINAIKFADHLDPPPKSLGCPVVVIVSFICKDQIHGGYVCKVHIKPN